MVVLNLGDQTPDRYYIILFIITLLLTAIARWLILFIVTRTVLEGTADLEGRYRYPKLRRAIAAFLCIIALFTPVYIGVDIAWIWLSRLYLRIIESVYRGLYILFAVVLLVVAISTSHAVRERSNRSVVIIVTVALVIQHVFTVVGYSPIWELDFAAVYISILAEIVVYLGIAFVAMREVAPVEEEDGGREAIVHEESGGDVDIL
jgi:hypothetical protein